MVIPIIMCPLCGSVESSLFHKDAKREFSQCPRCLLVFVPSEFHLEPDKEKAEYDLHENNPSDPGYRKFLSRLSEPLLRKLPPNQKGLDFGCGPGPALAMMMKMKGYSMDLYDLYYYPDDTVFENKYDFITATEVFEHLKRPGQVFGQLINMLHNGGILGIMTKLVIDQKAFRRWHYIQDPTHICYFSRETFEYLSEKYSLQIDYADRDVVFFQK